MSGHFYVQPASTGQPVPLHPPASQVNAIVHPTVPVRAAFALDLMAQITDATRRRGIDGAITQRDMTKIEEHAYEVALMTAASYCKGDAFHEQLAVVPVVFILFSVFGQWLTLLPALLRTLVFSAVTVTLMTYVIMPRMTRLFSFWLYPDRD